MAGMTITLTPGCIFIATAQAITIYPAPVLPATNITDSASLSMGFPGQC